MGPTGQIKCKQLTSEVRAGYHYHHCPSRNYNPFSRRMLAAVGRSLSLGRDVQTKKPPMDGFLGGTARSWRVPSVWFSGRRVSCIMHGGCYFHHMVLSGFIVGPAPSAQIAVCSQIALLVSTLTLSPPLTLSIFSPSLLYFTAVWKWG